MQPAPSAIHSVSGSNVNSQFHYAFANGLRIANPLDERGTPIFIPVVDEFDHKAIVA
jgi:hypothetical protein